MPDAPDAIWVRFDATSERCQGKKAFGFGSTCGARLVLVRMSPYAATLAAHYGAKVKDGDKVCARPGSSCGIQTGLGFKPMLNIVEMP